MPTLGSKYDSAKCAWPWYLSSNVLLNKRSSVRPVDLQKPKKGFRNSFEVTQAVANDKIIIKIR